MTAARNRLLDLLGIELPIIQAPMAGVSSPAMAAAVSNAGGLGSIGVGATNAEGARAMIADIRVRSNGPVNVNVFCHRPAQADPRRESAWIDRFAVEFAKLDAPPPASLTEHRIEFTAGRDIVLSPPQRGEPLNYFVFPYAEAQGRPIAPPPTEVRFRRMPPDEAVRAGEMAP